MQNKSGFEDGPSRIVSRRGRCETRVLTPSRVVSCTGPCDFPSTILVQNPRWDSAMQNKSGFEDGPSRIVSRRGRSSEERRARSECSSRRAPYDYQSTILVQNPRWDSAMQNKSGFEDGPSGIVSRRGRCETRVLTPSRVASYTGPCDFPSTILVQNPRWDSAMQNKSGFEDGPSRIVSRRGRCETPVLTSSPAVSCTARCVHTFCQD